MRFTHGLVVLGVLFVAGGCSSASTTPDPPGSDTAAPVASAAPPLGYAEGDTVIAEVLDRSGDGAVEFEAAGSRAIVYVSCADRGAVEVSIDDGTDVAVPCTDGVATRDTFDLGALAPHRIDVDATGDQRWSVAVATLP